MGLWDAVKTVAGQWGDVAGAQKAADAIVKRLSGIDPLHFHPKVYRVVAQAAQQQYEHYQMRSASPLTHDEMALLKLIGFYVLSREAGHDDKCEAFGRAIRALRKESGSSIRAALSLEATAETGF